MTHKSNFLAKHQKVPVQEFENNVSKNPLLSVCVQTYNQENFIAKCLDGILIQQTNFDFEILVGEDESSDKTRAICKKYALGHPDKIKLFLHSRENNIKVYGKPTPNFNSSYNLINSTGKYIAFCEGDDFWTDPLKLQKQVDFLEANSDYGMIFSDVIMIDENDKEISTTTFHEKIKSLYKSGSIFWDLMDQNFINTLTICVKRDLFMSYHDTLYKEYSYDYMFWLYIATYTKIKYIDEKWASYRMHDLGISKSNDFFIKREPLVKQSTLANYILAIKADSDLINQETFSKTTYSILKNKNLSITEKGPTFKLLRKHPKLFIYLMKWIIKTKVFKLVPKKND